MIHAQSIGDIKTLAELGDKEAEYRLGLIYYTGEETDVDYNTAFYWFRRSALQGYALAQWQLSRMFYRGKGTAADVGKHSIGLKKVHYRVILKRSLILDICMNKVRAPLLILKKHFIGMRRVQHKTVLMRKTIWEDCITVVLVWKEASRRQYFGIKRALNKVMPGDNATLAICMNMG